MMASGVIPVPHEPEFHAFTTLPQGVSAQPAGAANGYYIFPDGRIRIEINVKGLTANQMNVLITGFAYPPTKAGSYGNAITGTDGNTIAYNKCMGIQVINDGRIRVFSTSQFAIGLWVEYYP